MKRKKATPKLATAIASTIPPPIQRKWIYRLPDDIQKVLFEVKDKFHNGETEAKTASALARIVMQNIPEIDVKFGEVRQWLGEND